MASLSHANLDSDDEQDEDYDPSKDPTGEKETVAENGKASKRRRGQALSASEDAPEGSKEAECTVLEQAHQTPAQLAKKAKVSTIWEQLQHKTSATAAAGPRGNVSLASLCKPIGAKKKDPDMVWMKSLGLVSKTQPQATSSTQPSTSQPAAPDATAKSAAAAAIAAAREAASAGIARGYNKVTVTETRKFAGKDIKVTVEVDKDSKEAQKAAERSKPPATGLDAFLSEIEKKKKVSVLDKTKMDWKDYKKTDAELEEELESYKKSDKTYLDKQDFLKRAELREYEQERDKRLASDVRLRGRL
eukprot:jgi/Chrzof1/13280/Cz07g27110.t1